MSHHNPTTPNGEVWPPPPTIDSTPPSGLSAYVSTRRLSQVVIALTWATVAMYVYNTLVDVSAMTQRRTPLTTLAIGEAITMLNLVVSLVGYILFLVWTYRVYRNLSAFGVQGLRYSTAWAVGGFFVPFLSLYRPYQVFREIWQASDTSPRARVGQQWQLTKVPALLPIWWICYLAAGVLVLIDSLNGSHATDQRFNLAGDTLSAVLVVRAITDRQERAAHGAPLPRSEG